jgi:GPH family glycoside/pentoside/hexuronide:cation symporter
MTNVALDLHAAPAPLQRRVLLAYGVGDAGTGMASALVGFYLFVFYTAVAGLPAWLAGTVLMVVRLWDVFSDQLIGWLGDRTHHRLGPRVPWMLWGALPLGVSMALMWWVPPFTGPWRLVWFVGIAALFQMSYSLVNLPYSALPAELTANVALRTRLVSARFSGSVLASLVGLLLGASLTGQGATGYWRLGLAAGLVLVLGSLTSAIGLAPAAATCSRPNPPQSRLLPQLRRLGRNPRFLRVVALYLLLWSALQLMQPVAILYLADALHLPAAWSKGLLIPFQISALLGIWIWDKLAARRSRLLALQIGGSAWILLCLLAILLPVMPISGEALAAANLGPLLLLLVSLMGLGISAATAYLLPWSFLPDAIDAEANHPAGLITAFLVQIQKLGSALSVFVLGWLLSWSGYQASLGLAQPPQALLMIRLCMGLLPALLVGAGLWVMRDWERIGARVAASGGAGGDADPGVHDCR